MKCRAAAKSRTEVQIWTNKIIKASAEELSILSTGQGVDKDETISKEIKVPNSFQQSMDC